jgi:hypothetical protein
MLLINNSVPAHQHESLDLVIISRSSSCDLWMLRRNSQCLVERSVMIVYRENIVVVAKPISKY